MDVLINKGLLLAFGCLLLLECANGKAAGMLSQAANAETVSSCGDGAAVVAAFLIAVTIAAFGYCIEKKKYMWLLWAVIFLQAAQNPYLLLFFPVYLYDVLDKKLWAGLSLLLLYVFPVFVSLEPMQKALFMMSSVLAFFLQNRTMQRASLKAELIRIRDDGIERNLILKEKNKALMEKQDYEIYLATLRERNRIAREIHDTVGHMLSRALLMTGALLTIEKEGVVHEQLQNLRDTLDTAMTDIRQSVHDLHEDSIDLQQSMLEILQPLQMDYAVHLDYDMSNQVPKKVKYCLIAITKEAVSNVLKHSNGDTIQLRIREHPAFYQCIFEDNGTACQADSENGIGILNMKERIHSLGGTFRVQTQGGFTLFMTIPKTEETVCG